MTINRLIVSMGVLASATMVNAQSMFHFGTNSNPAGITVNVDSRGFVVGGKHVLPVMGEIHYSRVPAKDWVREIKKMKAGGITMIATYVFWNHHETEEGVWNWSGNMNLREFIKVCGKEGMPVILRIGPFCHGEVYQGGIPTYVVERAQRDAKQYKIRSQAPGFMDEVNRLYSNIYAQVNDLLWKNGGPIVGVQIENECRGPWSYYMALKDMAVRIGFDTPFYTRTGWPKLNGKEEFGKMLPLYGDYADGFWDRTLNDMPGEYPAAFEMKDKRMSEVIATETFSKDELKGEETKEKGAGGLTYPYLTCELGGGMMPSYHRRVNMSGMEPLPLAICKLGSGSNMPGYYMYHGGTNPDPVTLPDGTKRTMAETQASPVTNYNDMPYMSYDFQCQLGEMGQPNLAAFHSTRLLHQFLADWGEELSQMDVDSLSKHYGRRGCFEFYNDYVRINNEQGVCYVRPVNMPFKGHSITADVQPFCKIGNALYFVPIKGRKPVVMVDGKKYACKLDRCVKVGDIEVTVMSEARARATFVIGGALHVAKHDGGLLYESDGVVKEEYWQLSEQQITATERQKAGAAREVKMGVNKVAAMPSDADFDAAAVYDIDVERISLPEGAVLDDQFLQIEYEGDCARVYADGKLVEDNFWNGKAMLVRLSALKGKKVELRILPLRKDAPIYLQKEQRAVLNAAEGDTLLRLKGVRLFSRLVV